MVDACACAVPRVLMVRRYATAFPEKAAQFARRFGKDGTHTLPEGWSEGLPAWTAEDSALATRKSHAKVLNAVAEKIPEMVGGSADLSPSNLTELACSGDFQKETPIGRYVGGVAACAACAACAASRAG